MSSAKGKGSIFSAGSCTDSQSDVAAKGITYQYATNNRPESMPQYGFLEMSANVKYGRIHLEMDYWNSKYGKKYAFALCG